ncbi:uncharacterized protein LOC125497827 [Beta vulgaris subsp. vulgaris]|uniref:uncharacterized protein LOC125497827 n=1 Tax=Beta vulgaris subsp. vulgaris TaxID=3555 RepID=UPI002036CCED|nr:uncharacterized protein LOC125497827 [Beta vulgaris subsp. vulgaris]
MSEEGKIDPAHPYYLGAGDQPGNLITHLVLKGDNYLVWSRAITLSLRPRRKFVFVDGTITKPTKKKKLLDWEKVNSMLVSWLLRSLDTKLAATVPYFEEVKKLWDYLEQRFCDSNGPRLQQLRSQITDCKQTKGMSVEDYYTKLMGLFDDLTRLKPPHGCECGRPLLLQTLLVLITLFFKRKHRAGLLAARLPKDVKAAHVFAFNTAAARGKVYPERRDKTKLYCSHCKKTGHDNKGCFVLHGYPEWWYELKRRREASATGTTAARSSPKPAAAASSSAAGTVRANAVNTSSTLATSGGGENLSLADLKPEDIRVLLNMVNHNKQDRLLGETLCSFWIIDTGASHHVTGNELCLMDVYPIQPCPVGLPNGAQAEALKAGRVLLDDNVTLEHVLLSLHYTAI